MSHVMIDIETMGSSHRAAIVSIGAVRFEPEGPPLPADPLATDHFFRCVSLESSMAAGLEVDASTVEWWLGQDQEARQALREHDPIALRRALHELSKWLLVGCECVWSHGATFDLVILDSAYRALGNTPPWSFRDARDTRTLFGLFAGAEAALRTRGDRRHHPLWDAWRQADLVQQAYALLAGSIGEARLAVQAEERQENSPLYTRA